MFDDDEVLPLRPDGSLVRAGIYSRQSKNKTKSIQDQLVECRRDVSALGWSIIFEYTEGESASNIADADRPEWENVKADLLAKKVDVLVLWESSRGDRDAESWLGLLKLCRQLDIKIRITGTKQTFDVTTRRDWKWLAEEGIDNEDETWKTQIRVQRGLAANAEAGKPHGKTPFGYVRVYDEHTRAFLRQIPDTRPREALGGLWTPAEVVQGLFQDTLRGVPLTAQVHRLNDRGIPVPRKLTAQESQGLAEREYRRRKSKYRATPEERWSGVKWETTVIRSILTNKSYLGIREHKGKETRTECWPALVTSEQFYAVKNLLDDPDRQTVRDSKAKYLLSCLARCECGLEMVYLGPGGKRRTATYRCERSHCAVPMAEANGFVTAAALRVLTAPTWWESLRATTGQTSQEVATIRGQIEKARAEKTAWEAQLDNAEMEIDPAVFSRRLAALTKKIKDLEQHEMQRQVPAVLHDFVGTTAEQAVAAWKSLDLDRQRTVLRYLFKLTMRPVGKGRRHVPMGQRIECELRQSSG